MLLETWHKGDVLILHVDERKGLGYIRVRGGPLIAKVANAEYILQGKWQIQAAIRAVGDCVRFVSLRAGDLLSDAELSAARV